ncbi:nucleoside hydrolase [Pseudactinotalea sp. HY160]|uniref:nucleoside hydrolase n=1 Tax=Pseudactinotalea sp. HY160 TaxID=2654490 RepID=UPI0013122BC4|nr:nucleoside hydrolase [Pseudactinotalea sp. HY160]
MTPLPLLLDCDPGIDDALALAYGAAHGAEYVACTVTHGNVPVETGARNALTVLDVLGLADVPVHLGAARPLAQPLRTAEAVHGGDGLGDTGRAPSTRSLAGTLAPVELVRLARAHPGELTLVAVGPLTNIGIALLLDPEFAGHVRRVVVMGGAILVPGNATALAEANTFCDPEAAQLVIDAPWDLTWVGLEATRRTAVPPELLDRLATTATPHGRFLWAAMQHYLDRYERTLGRRTCLLHDPLAMALAVDHRLASYRLVRAGVELRGERTRGQVTADLRPGRPDPEDARVPGVVRIVEDLDVAAFHDRFLGSLTG